VGRRLELSAILKTFCPNVYFQPSNNVTMTYPAIVYQRAPAISKHAGNQPYNVTDQYEITVIDRNPDSEIPSKVATLPTSRHSRFFIIEGLNHDVYNIFF
jgi:hypothetical protein